MMQSRQVTQQRRTVLKNSWTWIKIGFICSLLYPVLRFVGYQVPKKPRNIIVQRKLAADGYHVDKEFILFEDAESGPWSVSRTCTHLGCSLNYSEKDKLLICPCHQSMFTKKGLRIDGPARRNLAVYPVERIKDDTGNSTGYVVAL